MRLGLFAIILVLLHLTWSSTVGSLRAPGVARRARGIFEGSTHAEVPRNHTMNTIRNGTIGKINAIRNGTIGKLDIVLTHYHLDTLNETTQWWSGFLNIAMVKELRPSVYVYCQNPEITDLSPLEPLLKYGGKLVHLDNLGRESHAYLTHILKYYNELPEHVLFSQDIPVDEKLWHRFQNMFEPKTGFLPLAIVGHQDCEDGWLPSGLMPQLYAMFTKKICPPEGFTAAYNGQFLVSRKRLRALDWWTYHHLLELVSAPQSHWIHKMHNDAYFKSPENPMFGHVVERAWSLAFTCWDHWREHNCWECDKKQMQNCGGDACQCWDPPEEAAPEAGN